MTTRYFSLTLFYMKNNKNLIIGAVVVVALVVGGYFLLRPGKDSCEYYETFNYADSYLSPWVGDMTKLKIYPNYYKCNAPQKGDIVYYEHGQAGAGYLRIIRAVPGDRVKLQPDADKRGWNLIVNDSVLMHDDKPYYFGLHGVNPVLNLYIRNAEKIMGANELILFSSNPPGFNDSGLFGLYSVSSIRGKVVVPEEKMQGLSVYIANSFKAKSTTTTTLVDNSQTTESVEGEESAAEATEVNEEASTTTTTLQPAARPQQRPQQRQQPRQQTRPATGN